MKNITFINAGAGSGKTYRLTTDLAHLLTQEGLEPSQVILTTYTEIAAAEFREKARKEILNAKDKNGNLIDATVRINKATQLDNAYIGTVHAISFRFIRKYWYLLSYGADIQAISDQNQDFYMSQSISSIVTDADRKVFREFRDTFDIKNGSKPDHLFWLPELKSIVDKMKYYDINDVQKSIEESKKMAKAIFTGMTLDKALKTISTFLNELCRYLTKLNNKEKIAEAQTALKKMEDNGSIVLRNLADLRVGTGSLLDEYGDGRRKEEKALKKEFYDRAEYKNAKTAYDETAVSQDYLPQIEKYLDTIFNLALRWQNEIDKYKQENHIVSFDDMEKIFLAMLTDKKYKEVQDDIAANFRLLMVDEFQDSNPIQLKIFNRISELIAENDGHSIWVGDPKQAIYGFRGSDSRFIAEILSMFEFSKDGKPIKEQGDKNLGTDQLLQSWRSRPALVEFANKIFLEPFKKNGLKEKQIALEPHYKDTDTLDNTQALYIWRTATHKSAPRAQLLAKKIQKMLESKLKVHHKECDKDTSEITYRDIAVLCYSNSECHTVASQLRKLGLPASCEETNLMQCLEVYLVKTLLLFMQKPTDKMLRAELVMMLNDTTTEDILKKRIKYVNENAKEENGWDLWLDPDNTEIIKKLTDLTRRYQRLSVYDTVVAICEEMDIANIVEKWGDSTQRRHNLSTIVNMAKTYDDMCLQMGIGSSISGFVNYLAITKPDNQPDNFANTIKVLTYHRSKGLEWPVVILYQLWKEFGDEGNLAKSQFCGVKVCKRGNGATDIFNRHHYISLFPSGMGGAGSSTLPELMQKNIVNQELFIDIKKQTQEEALRLLYVGVTRAKDYLVSLTSQKDTKDRGDVQSAWPMYLGIGNGGSDAPLGNDNKETIEELEGAEGDGGNATAYYKQTTNTPGINSAQVLNLSPSTIASFGNAFTGNVQAAEAGQRIIDWDMFRGEQSDAVKGSCIHNIYAAYRPGDDDGNILRTTQTLINYGFGNVSDEQKEKILASIKWLHNYLTQTYGPATRIEKECPLLYPLPSGQMLRGEIDLQWYYTSDNQEKCVLIDYKTFPGRRDQLESHTEQYYPQLSAYHAALTAAGIDVVDTLIYYPVQAHVRKLIR